MVVLSKDICAYLDFLIQKQGLFVSLHGKMASFKEFFKYNIHLHPFCSYVKHGSQEKCIEQQKKVMKHCKTEAFFGTCYAGMSEWIYPLCFGNEAIGFISVGGYCCNTASYNLSDKIVLLPKPSKESIDAVIRPLVNLCEAYYKENFSDLARDTGFMRIIDYVNEHYTEKLSIKKLSEKFNYSISSISHQFKKNTGMSLSVYVEQLKIHHAKRLLAQTNLNVTEISMLLDFCNSGYLSALFKKYVGVSPSQYRKLKDI